MNEPQVTVMREGGFSSNEDETQLSAASNALSTRAQSEVLAAMHAAKQFPRDEAAAYARVMKSCSRPSLAKLARYRFPRGREEISGPTIKLIMEIARAWGNCEAAVIELERKDGESQMMAVAVDLETGFRSVQIFITKHQRETKSGTYQLTGDRDIYEATANVGARRLRKCLERILPPDVIEAAEEQCVVTQRGDTKVPLQDRVRKMVTAFDQMGVPPKTLEIYLRHGLDELAEEELDRLREIYITARERGADPKEIFASYAKTREDESGIREKVGQEKAPAASARATGGAGHEESSSASKNATAADDPPKKSKNLPSKAEMVAEFRALEPDIHGALAETLQEDFEFSFAAFDTLTGSKMAKVLEKAKTELSL